MRDVRSLTELKKLIHQARQPILAQDKLVDKEDVCQRFARIKRREGGILFLVLQQWIDILLLFEDCALEYPQRRSQFSIEATRPFTRSGVKRRGNPLLMAESDITDDLLRRL